MPRCGVIALMLLIAALPQSAPAQSTVVPAVPDYAINPLGPPPQSPVQQQAIESYRSQLLQTQRAMSWQNPSGVGRQEIEINRRLFGIGNAPPVAAAPPPANSVPSFAPVVPMPPFNAAPRP